MFILYGLIFIIFYINIYKFLVGYNSIQQTAILYMIYNIYKWFVTQLMNIDYKDLKNH